MQGTLISKPSRIDVEILEKLDRKGVANHVVKPGLTPVRKIRGLTLHRREIGAHIKETHSRRMLPERITLQLEVKITSDQRRQRICRSLTEDLLKQDIVKTKIVRNRAVRTIDSDDANLSRANRQECIGNATRLEYSMRPQSAEVCKLILGENHSPCRKAAPRTDFTHHLP